ncbi:MAG: DUF2249 domain-containing protein [Candidatus Nanopelagicales bacterium]
MDITLGTADEPAGTGGCGGHCTCGAQTDTTPVLDVRTIPQLVRHATVLGALGGLPAGTSLVLVAPHDPLPLLRELEEREPGAFAVGYDERGPETWHVRLTRTR